MSHIGKKEIKVPKEVIIAIKANIIEIIGPLGKLEYKKDSKFEINYDSENKIIKVKPINSIDKSIKEIWGTNNRMIANMIEGVSKGYNSKLKIEGVGYKVNKIEDKLILEVGKSHNIEYEIPKGIKVEIINNNIIIVKGIDKILVGKTIAEIKETSKPNKYRIKGIYLNEEIPKGK